jgi:hypothetical protein
MTDDSARPEEWAKIQTMGIGRTLDRYQHQALDEWFIRQIHGGPEWGPRWWMIDGWARPRTTGKLSCHLRVKLKLAHAGDGSKIGSTRMLVWVMATRWETIKPPKKKK